METNENDSALLSVTFFSTQKQLNLPSNPFSVPATSDHNQLNQLVRSLLSSDVDYDFLHDGRLIRNSLQDVAGDKLLEHNLSLEVVVRCPPPELTLDLSHPDWVASVIADKNFIVSGTYDGSIQVWCRASPSKPHTIKEHTGAVKALAFIPDENEFVSASHDQSLGIFGYNESDGTCTCRGVLRGHERSVQCVSVNQDGNRIASAGFDTLLKIWNTESPTEADIKKPRLYVKQHAPVHTPMVTLSGHKEVITGVEWCSPQEVVTVSWDQTIRLWDLTMAGEKTHLTGTKAHSCVSCHSDGCTLLTGANDKHIRLWDTRSKEGSLVKTTFTSHTNWVTAVKWHPINPLQFVSCSLDRVVKLWDTRSHKAPIYDLAAHEEKALTCDFSTDGSIVVSGGADNAVKVYNLASNATDA